MLEVTETMDATEDLWIEHSTISKITKSELKMTILTPPEMEVVRKKNLAIDSKSLHTSTFPQEVL